MRAPSIPALARAIAAALITTVVATSTPGFAQTQQNFPSKPVRVVAGAYGSPSDILARTLGPKLSESWGQPVVVENRAGAAGMIGANIVAKAPADGYTLLLISAQFAILAVVQSNLPYDSLKDFAGVTQLGFSTSALVVNPALGVKTVREFIALAQAKPGQIFFSSGGAGSSTHINAERFRYAAGIKAVHVGFKGTPDALIEVLAGRVHYCIVGLGAALPFIRDGRLVALAVSTPQRSPLLPDVPAMAEVLPGFGTDGSHSLLAPAGTPRPILNKISKDVARILDLPEVKERLQSMGYHLAPTTPEEHDRIVRAQIQTFSEVARMIGLKSK
jgi:tripartite-type tricarboxylate transporter receptor subunit TctC